MKKILLFILLMLLTFIGNAQKKKEFYYDADFNRVSKYIFKQQLDKRYALPKIIENDTAIIGKLIYRQAYGYINEGDKNKFIKLLSKIAQKKVDTSKIIVISFFYDYHSGINYYSSEKRYLNFFKKTKNRNKYEQLFITEKGYEYKSKFVDIFEDHYDVMKKLFFKYRFGGGNYLILKPDGEYIKYYGEYPSSAIIRKLEKGIYN